MDNFRCEELGRGEITRAELEAMASKQLNDLINLNKAARRTCEVDG